ncbi:MAG TPA: Crp/Fnr family transcriptional regulator [Armatimonadota bacterium]|nr:Crp/Fnr family transcriptional regulator [Armatimonadota bacterium]
MVTRTKSPCELVREFPFFAGLDPAIYDVLLARGLTRRYAKGEMLFLDGEPCKGLFFVQSGMVKIFKLNENGREQILAVQRPGDSVAELPVFDDGPYPASAAAMEDAEVLFIPAAAFHELLTQYPQLCHAVITALGRRLRTLVGLVEDLSLRQVRQRLARLLLEESAGGETFRLRFTNEELAARLGSVRDVISRTLSGLQNDALIGVTGRQVTIRDREGLEAAAE